MRRAAGGALLGVIVFAAGYAAGQAAGVRKEREAGRRRPASQPSPCAPTPRRQLIAYFFHGTTRSPADVALEAAARNAIEVGFANHLEAGDIVWQPTNMDEAWNRDFVDRYGLTRSALVLVDVNDGREEGHTVCARIQDLGEDESALGAYVKAEVDRHLAAWGD